MRLDHLFFFILTDRNTNNHLLGLLFIMIRQIIYLAILLISIPISSFGNQYQDGRYYYKIGQIEKAKKAFYQHYINYPNSYYAPYSLYYYTKTLSNTNNIVQNLTRIKNQYPNFVHLDKILDELATLFFLEKNYQKSFDTYSELFNKFTKSQYRGKACFYIGKILMLKKQFETANSFLLNHYKLFNKNRYFTGLLYLIGVTIQMQNDYNSALQYYQQIIRGYPYSEHKASAYYQSGICYFQLNQGEKGYQQLRTVLSQYPNSLEGELAKLYLNNNFKSFDNLNLQNYHKPSPTLDKSQYFLQAGAYSNRKNALNLKDKITRLGFHSFIIITLSNGKTYHKLLIGGFESKSKALQASKYLTTKKINSFLIRK